MEERLKKIRLLLLDVDGVLTDGRIIINDRGEETKAFHVRDGHGMKLLQRAGVQIGIITGRSSRVVAHRMRELGVDLVVQGSKDKRVPYQQMLEQTGLEDHEIAYVGDDLVDLPLLRRVGFAATVADGCDDLKEHVHYVTRRPGGMGAVREICEMILKARGAWEQVTLRYWQD
ncbi:MAG: HAD-IIIA family hydrolase [Deltaproteobacteria bacterium]|nr:MAG: HAD-IIIA family hydrolase [Deltaproteobacteria bacterium]